MPHYMAKYTHNSPALQNEDVSKCKTHLGLCSRISAVVDNTSTSPFRTDPDVVDDAKDGVGDDFCLLRKSREICSAFFDDDDCFGGTLPKNFQPSSPLSQGSSSGSCCFGFLEKKPLLVEPQKNMNILCIFKAFNLLLKE